MYGLMKILGGKNDFIPNLATSTVLFPIPFRPFDGVAM